MGFDMNCVVFTRTPKEKEFPEVEFVSFEKLLSKSDFISIHCPATTETKNLFDEKAFSIMKPNSFLINTARGSIIDEDALIAALQNKKIAGAALDVMNPEPPLENNPLLAMENVFITPHIGWTGLEARQRLISSVANNISNFLKGKEFSLVN